MLVPGQKENDWHNGRVSWLDQNSDYFCQVPLIVIGPNGIGSTASGSVTWWTDECEDLPSSSFKFNLPLNISRVNCGQKMWQITSTSSSVADTL